MNLPSADAGADRLSTAIDAALRAVPDFPKPGILFRDITPLLATPSLFVRCTNAMADSFSEAQVTHVVAVESRGFIFGAPIAQRLGAAFVPVRKPGKLPYLAQREEYALEYGTNSLEIHTDACTPSAAVLIVDDVLATGGTAAAAGRLVERVGGRVVGYSFLVELDALNGRALLGAPRVESLLRA
jgi:adenine phosphoribosyltransferase